MSAHPFDMADATARLGHDQREADYLAEQASDRLDDFTPTGERVAAFSTSAVPAPRWEGLLAHLELFADAVTCEGKR